MIVDLLASPAVAGFSVSKIRGQGPCPVRGVRSRSRRGSAPPGRRATRSVANEFCPFLGLVGRHPRENTGTPLENLAAKLHSNGGQPHRQIRQPDDHSRWPKRTADEYRG